MKMFNEFKIPFVGLKEGNHHFDYQIGKEFFDAFGYNEFDQMDFKVEIQLDKKSTMMELFFTAQGIVNTLCDVTGEEFDLDVTGEFPLIVKFGEVFNNDNEELLIIPHTAYELELHQYIYELIVLSIPQKRVKSGTVTTMKKVEEVDKTLQTKEDKNKEIDPRWDQLKQLLDKK